MPRSLFMQWLFTLALSSAQLQAAPTQHLPADWYPESLTASRDGDLYVGSWHQGAIARLPAGGEPAELLVPSGQLGLRNTQGLLVDDAHDALWACSADFGYSTAPSSPSALKRYALHSGQPVASYPLPAQGICNDLVLDTHGRILISDSGQPRILALEPGASALSVWLEDPALATDRQQGLTLNGLVLDGPTLYVSKVAAVPYLLAISLDAAGSPQAVRQLPLPRVLKNADALRRLGPQQIVIFESDTFGASGSEGGQITLLDLRAPTPRLTVLANGLDSPSSGAISQGRLYWIESGFRQLFQHAPSGQAFTVQSLALPR